MKTTLDCKKEFLCVLTESEISHGPRGAIPVKEWHPVHAAEEAEVRTLAGAQLPRSIQTKEFT